MGGIMDMMKNLYDENDATRNVSDHAQASQDERHRDARHGRCNTRFSFLRFDKIMTASLILCLVLGGGSDDLGAAAQVLVVIGAAVAQHAISIACADLCTLLRAVWSALYAALTWRLAEGDLWPT